MRRGERGVANILVICLVAIGLAAMVAGYLAQAELTRNQQEQIRLAGPDGSGTKEGATYNEKQRFAAASDRAKAIIELAGWPKDPFNPDADLDGVMDEMVKSRMDHLNARKDDMGLNGKDITIADLFAGDFDADNPKKFRDGSTTMERILEAADARLGIVQGTLLRVQHELEVGQASTTHAQERMNEVLAQKDKEIGALSNGDEASHREGVKQLKDRLDAVTSEYDQAVARKKAQLDKVKDQQKTQQNELEKKTNSLMGEISRTIQALEEIQKKEAVVRDITRPQGHVVNPQADGRSCYINLGGKDGVFLGERFRVFSKGFAGINVWKGEIEVKRIMGETSLCNVLARYDRSNPLIEGDLVYNPLYNAGKPRVIVVLGDYDTLGVSKDDFARKVKAHGGRIDDKITWETDYVMLGHNVDQGSAQYKEGALIGVPFVGADQILPYLGN